MCDDPFSLNNSIRLLSSQLCQSCFAQLWQHEGTIKEVEIMGLCSFSHFKDHLNAHGGVKRSQCSIRSGSPNQPYSSLLRCMTVMPPKHPQWPPADTPPVTELLQGSASQPRSGRDAGTLFPSYTHLQETKAPSYSSLCALGNRAGGCEDSPACKVQLQCVQCCAQVMYNTQY